MTAAKTGLAVIVLLVIALALVALAKPMADAIKAASALAAEETYHAETSHAESELIKSACQNNGVYQFWREPNGRIHQLCQLGDGRFGDWIVEKAGDHNESVTRFIPKDGDWNKILDWLRRKGATRIKSIP